MLKRQLYRLFKSVPALPPLAAPLFPARTAAAGSQNLSAPAVSEGLWPFLGTNLGRSLLVLGFFLVIVLTLRFLFGPRGRLRDPAWDRLSEEQKLSEAAGRKSRLARWRFRRRLPELAPQLEPECEIFKEYVAEFLSGSPERDSMLLLKQEHSLNVLGHALSLAAYEDDFQPRAAGRIREPDRVLLLAALYHDLGRFEQLKRYQTFRDELSVNHGQLGAFLLRSELTDGRPRFMLGASSELRGQVAVAVLLHNRFALPGLLDGEIRPICHAVRDADKLDIIRVMCAELAPGRAPDPTVVLGLADRPEKYSQTVLQSVLKNGQASYKDLRYVNDFRLLLCSWLNCLVYGTSRRILARSGQLEQIMGGLPPDRALDPLRESISTRLEKYRL